MPSQTDVANAALRLIGGGRITSFTDGSKEANACQDLYTDLLDGLLRKHFWNFATKRERLARSSTAPGFEFSYAYPVPSDWLRTVRVSDNDAGTGTIVYRQEQVAGQRCIVCSAEAVYLEYVARETDPNMWSADFVQAMEYALARDLAVPIAESNTLREEMRKEAKDRLAAAASTDAAGSFPRQRPRGSWASARGLSGYTTERR